MKIKLDENIPLRVKTQDIGIADARVHAVKSHGGMLLVRLCQPGRDAVRTRVIALFQSEDVETWRGHIVVATERKLRVRRALQQG